MYGANLVTINAMKVKSRVMLAFDIAVSLVQSLFRLNLSGGVQNRLWGDSGVESRQAGNCS